ncbi:hypothetical protein TraAM80_08205 [Trypanosoma rangeli]|uniref:Uncharacterized protein n=1 Tax=Trypanosoma rangeli TaxID=5698 RepID=A0A422N1R3_TRYRA|nr:uncharacterized protein TraAM80_08205 [Trypanosoma rangeli]RNE99408.1 hypothetical protein TraAM80_08205 [Trypanosoma rangeli]|eukprot:RNE99408.1 hypothetical protein TraAM80_08205 [Trypanosoma rangeli]
MLGDGCLRVLQLAEHALLTVRGRRSCRPPWRLVSRPSHVRCWPPLGVLGHGGGGHDRAGVPPLQFWGHAAACAGAPCTEGCVRSAIPGKSPCRTRAPERYCT